MTMQPDGSVILTKNEDAMETARATYDALLAALWDTETDTTERKRLENWI